MITLCPQVDDEHAAFPHRLVIKEARTVMQFGKQVWIPGCVLVICANCDHWIERAQGDCHCVWRCHEQSEPATTTRRVRNQTVTKLPA